MKARDVKINNNFVFNEKVLTRVLFEGKPEILYRCTMNIVALTSEENVVFISLNEVVSQS